MVRLERMTQMPDVYQSKIVETVMLAEVVFSVTVVHGDLAKASSAGQFLHIKCGVERLLRRPISICTVRGNEVNFVFEVKGEGTRWLSECKPGQVLDILGPLGNGFTFPEGRIIVVGGGIGTPPMLYTAESATGGAAAVLGFRDKSKVILKNEFEAVCDKVFITTDDGSAGIHGSVTKPLTELLGSGDFCAVMSCGPFNMQKAVADLCKDYSVPCQVSLEERMGCGVGACLVCACATARDGVEHMDRVCIDGPVFYAAEVLWRS